MKEKDVFDLIMNSSPGDYTHDDEDGLYFYKTDINLRLQIMRDDKKTPYNAEWISTFADKKAFVELVRIYYLMTPIKRVSCVWVDGFRNIIPLPRIRDSGKNITINKFEHMVGSILNHPLPFTGFDQVLQEADIKIRDEEII